MEPITMSLASTVMSILMPYAKEGIDEFVKTAGKDAYEKAKGLVDSLKNNWSRDKEATAALENFEKNPGRYQFVLKDILDEQLETNNDLSKEVQKIINDMGPDLEIIQKMKEAENVVGLKADSMTSGKVTIMQDIEKARNTTGADVEHVGR